jgi:hypothetical protein
MGAEQVLGLKSCSGQIRREGMTRRVHPSAVRKRERVNWAYRWIMDQRLEIAPGPSKGLSREKEDSRMGCKHRQRKNELDVP